MAIGAKGEELKRQMMTVVTLRRELEALEGEWRDLLTVLEERAEEGDMAIAQAVNRERMALRRELVRQQLKNWARIGEAPLTPLQKRVLGLRFVQGCTWGDVVSRMKKAKQYLLREHNKALDTLAEHLSQKS